MDRKLHLLAIVALSFGSVAASFPNTTVAVWPMSENYSTTDYNRTLNGKLEQVRFGDGPTGFLATSIQFDGMMGSTASYTADALALDVGLGSFTIATHVWLESARDGLILTWNGLKPFPNGVKIYVFQDTLHVDLYSRDIGLEYGQLMKTFTFLRIPEHQWNFIGFSFERTTNTISLIVNELQRDIHLPLTFNFGASGIETRGGIYFGGHPKMSSPRPIQGRISCSMLFRSVQTLAQLRTSRTACMEALNGNESTGNPLGLWPLNSDYGTSDLSGHNLHGVMEQHNYSDGPDGRTDGAMTLGGHTAGYVDIDNIYDTLSFRSELTMFMYVFFDQMQDCNINAWHKTDPNGVSLTAVDGASLVVRGGTINVKLDSGHYVTDLCLNLEHNQSSHLNVPTATPHSTTEMTSNCNDRLHVQTRTWHFIGFSYNATSDIFTIWVDHSAVKYKIGKIGMVHLNTGSTLRLSGSGFLGSLAWVYVLSKSVAVQEAFLTHEATYRKLILEKKPFEPVTFWPLDNAKGLVDISRYRLPGKVNGATFVKGPNFIEQTALQFTGSRDSFLKVENKDNLLDFKSTVSVFVYIRQTSAEDCTVVQWLGEPNITSGVRLSILNGYVTVDLFPRGGHIEGNVYQGYQVIPDVWTFIGFTYDASDGLLLVWKDDLHPVIKNVGQYVLETRGDVHLGGHPDQPDHNFIGHVACLSMYGAMMNKNDVLFVRRTCQQRMYLMNTPVSLYPLTKVYLAADVAGYGNNGEPTNVIFTNSPDNSPERSTLFLKQQDSKVQITNYELQLDLNKELTLIAYIYVNKDESVNATIIEWDGMAYSSKGLTLLIENSHLTVDIYPNKYTLNSIKLEPETWYLIGLSYQYYHSLLSIWAETVGVNPKAFISEHSVSPQLLATRGNLVVGSSPSLLEATFSGRIACLMLYDKALLMSAGLEEGKQCFKLYLTTAVTTGEPLTTSSPHGPNIPAAAPTNSHPVNNNANHNDQPSGALQPSQHNYNTVLIPIVAVAIIGVVVFIVALFVNRRRKRERENSDGQMFCSTRPRRKRYSAHRSILTHLKQHCKVPSLNRYRRV